MSKVTAGYCSLREVAKGGITFQCYLGPEPPKVTDGYAIWEQVTRPKRKSVTEWQGVRPLRVTLDLLIDYFNSNVSNPGLKCESDMRDLELLAGATEKGKGAVHPPRISWDANAMHDNRVAGHITWVIESLTWGDLEYNDQESPNIVRAAATVVLMEWVDDEFIKQSGSSGASKNRTSKKKRKSVSKSKESSSYRVTVADTQKQGLRTIAQKLVKDSRRWREIAKVQTPPIRDPMAIRPNQILRRPKGW